MKVIFLDIDGVLNSAQSAIYHNFRTDPIESQFDVLCPISLALLQYIVEQTKSKIVISSTWRKYQSFDDLVNFFKKYNIDVVGKTPILNTVRGLEIKHWLEKHPKVNDFIILDDDSDMDEYTQTDHFIKTSHQVGLSYFEAIKIINKFNKKKS